MLTDKYSKLYIQMCDEANDKGQIVKKIINVENETGIELLDWNEEQLILFLKSFESISPISLSKNLTMLREFARFIAKQIGDTTERLYLLDTSMFIALIDREKLLSVTLSYEAFQNIRGQLGMAGEGETVNYRDKLVFELAWYGLTEDEIRMLKKVDVEFINRKEMEVAVLTLTRGKVVVIDDAETIEDIKQCMVVNEVTRLAKDGRLKTTGYRESEYLLRPGKSGGKSINTFYNKPSTGLKSAILKQDISCEGVDIFKLSLDDIRRSRLILLLAPKNEKFFDFKSVAGIYNLTSLPSMKWYKDVAILKYGEK